MKISKNLAIAMVNCDLSGLNEYETNLIEDFPDFDVIDWNENSNGINGKCAISGLWDSCAEIKIKENMK